MRTNRKAIAGLKLSLGLSLRVVEKPQTKARTKNSLFFRYQRIRFNRKISFARRLSAARGVLLPEKKFVKKNLRSNW